jgi:hypothetical protein
MKGFFLEVVISLSKGTLARREREKAQESCVRVTDFASRYLKMEPPEHGRRRLVLRGQEPPADLPLFPLLALGSW